MIEHPNKRPQALDLELLGFFFCSNLCSHVKEAQLLDLDLFFPNNSMAFDN